MRLAATFGFYSLVSVDGNLHGTSTEALVLDPLSPLPELFMLMRPSPKLIIALVIASSHLTSCGILKKPQNDNPQEENNILPPRTTTEEGAIFLDVEDADCQKTGTSVPFTSAQIWQWTGTNAIPRRVELRGTPDAAGDQNIESNGIIGAIYNFVMNYDCTKSEDDCKRSQANNSAGAVVKMCRADTAYQRDTIESVTLTAQYFATRAYDLYQTIPSRKPDLTKGILLVLPKFKRVYSSSNKTKIDSDNATFMKSSKSEDGIGIFQVLPTSVDFYKKAHLHFWEVPFVMAHEYGHNVFRHHVSLGSSVGLSLNDSKNRDLGLAEILPRRRDQKSSFQLASDGDIASMAFSGVDELFADLYGYYTNDGAPNQLRGVLSLEATRDLANAFTIGGSPKGISKGIIDILEGRASPLKPANKLDPAFDDEHDIATALGYVMASLLDSTHRGQPSGQKMDALIRWLNDFNIYINKANTSARLDGMIELMVKNIVATRTVSNNELMIACANFAREAQGLSQSVAACKAQ